MIGKLKYVFLWTGLTIALWYIFDLNAFHITDVNTAYTSNEEVVRVIEYRVQALFNDQLGTMNHD